MFNLGFYNFSRAWWRYILAPVSIWNREGLWWIRVPLCRWRGHPYGVVWFNPGALEPDMRCRNCGDDLG